MAHLAVVIRPLAGLTKLFYLIRPAIECNGPKAHFTKLLFVSLTGLSTTSPHFSGQRATGLRGQWPLFPLAQTPMPYSIEGMG